MPFDSVILHRSPASLRVFAMCAKPALKLCAVATLAVVVAGEGNGDDAAGGSHSANSRNPLNRRDDEFAEMFGSWARAPPSADWAPSNGT